jgi:ribonuclease HI
MAHGITIYTDGGSIYNPGPGGYGAIIIQDDRHQEITGGFRLTTNNRMELMACIAALRALKSRDRPITIFSDSSYVVNGISKGWAANWRRRGWIKADGKPAVNPDLWQELLNLVTGLDITFQWVRGHAGNPLNERCDELAVTTARQDNLPVDTEYERV